MTGQSPAKWAVSKTRNVTMSKASMRAEPIESERYEILSNSLLDLTDESDLVHEIGKLWREAQDRFLTIGRYLVQAKTRFKRTYEATILPQLPFGKGVAYQLRAVATAVDDGRLLEEELPHSYATAYQLVSLPPQDFERARQQNLVRRDVLRREVESFRTALRLGQDSDRRATLSRERQTLEQQIARLRQRINEIDVELGN
jgi:hypothetical protein